MVSDKHRFMPSEFAARAVARFEARDARQVFEAVVVRYVDPTGEARTVDVGPHLIAEESGARTARAACITLDSCATGAAARAVGEAFLAEQTFRPRRLRDRARLWLVRRGWLRP